MRTWEEAMVFPNSPGPWFVKFAEEELPLVILIQQRENKLYVEYLQGDTGGFFEGEEIKPSRVWASSKWIKIPYPDLY